MKKKKFASKLLSFFLAITMTLTLTPAVSAKAADKLETPTNVKLSKNETKINEDYSAGFKVSWTKVSGASMYKIVLKRHSGGNVDSEDNYYNTEEFYADGDDTSLICATYKTNIESYIKASVTALGANSDEDSDESALSNKVKISKYKTSSSSSSDYELYYNDNCNYSTWSKGVSHRQYGKKGKTVTVQKGPTRKGYTFLYWIDENGKQYKPGSKYKLSSRYNGLYAIWQVGKTKVKPGSGKSLSTPSKVKLSAKPYKISKSSDPMSYTEIMYHASWTKVDGAYGYLLYLDDKQDFSSSYNYLYNPFIVLGENTTSYDFVYYASHGVKALAVRPITKSELEKYEYSYDGDDYTVSNSVSLNGLDVHSNYDNSSIDVYSTKAVKFTTKSKTLTNMTSYVALGRKISYWWDSTTRKKVKSGDTFEGNHDIYPIWK